MDSSAGYIKSAHTTEPSHFAMEHIRYMDTEWEMVYAQCLAEEIATIAITECYGCKVHHLSQRQHSCLMHDDETNLYFYFHDAVKSLNDDKVYEKFKGRIQKAVPEDIISLYGKKFQCEHWRKTIWKSEDNLKHVMDVVRRIQQLEPRFTV